MGERHPEIEAGSSEKGLFINISHSVLHRLKSGGTAITEVTVDSENEWIEKLAEVDKDHTKKTGLHVKEAEKMLNNLNAYVNEKSQRSCPVDAYKVTECLKGNIGNTLACGRPVDEFKICVDKSLHEAVSKSMKEVRKSKKESYAETFERKYQF